MSTESLEIARIYNLINLFQMSKIGMDEYINISPKFIEDFRIAIKAITQLDKEITDPNLYCFISNVNMQYTITSHTEDSQKFIVSSFGAIIGGALGALFSKVFISNKGIAMHKGSILGFSTLGAALLESSLFEENIDQKRMDILSNAILDCYGPMDKIEIFGALPDEHEIIT